jgi:Protein of unknwon function (DUF3310)
MEPLKILYVGQFVKIDGAGCEGTIKAFREDGLGGWWVGVDIKDDSSAALYTNFEIGDVHPDMSKGSKNLRTDYRVERLECFDAKDSKKAVLCKGQIAERADMVNHPPHYKQGKVECIDAIEAAVMHLKGFEAHCTGTAIKYLWRWKNKGGNEDLKKAIWYINKILEK